MRDAIAILVSSSISLPPSSAPNPTSGYHSLPPPPPSATPKSRKFPGRKQSLSSTAALLHASPSRKARGLKHYADLASDLAEDGRFHDLLLIAESVVGSGTKPSRFAAFLNVKSVSAGICRAVEEGKVEGLIEVLGSLRKLGFAVARLFDEAALEALRKECRNRLQRCGLAEEIVTFMQTLQGLGFSPKQLLAPLAVIRHCVKKRNPGAAIRYAHIFPNVDTLLCTIMIEFGRKGDLVSALTVFEECKQNQGYPNTYAYRTIIDVCGLCGNTMKSRSIYEELLACKFTPNIYVFNSLMNVNASDLRFTMSIYRQMQKLGVVADLASYNILLKSCCLAARVDLALDVYREARHLESKGVLKLDVFTYSTMIKVLADARMWKMAFEIKEDMLLAGVVPNTVTWLSLISACANAGLVEQAIRLFEEMLHAGCEPNSQCYNILLHACVEARQYDRAFRLFYSWKKNGILKPVNEDSNWDTTNNEFVDSECDSFSTVSDSPSASEHTSLSKRFFFEPTTSTYNILMKACGTNYHHAKTLLNEMKAEGLSPNRISWSIIMDICGGLGNIKAALQILRSMHQDGIQPDVIAYTTAIKVCVEHNAVEVAFSLLAEMKRYHIKPNLVTYNTLLRARSKYGSMHQVQQCVAIYQDMRRAGYKPNDYYLRRLIEEWCEGVLQDRSQQKGQLTARSRSNLGPQSLLLEKVAERLRDGNVDSLSIDLRGLSRIEARIVVLAALRMIKEKYSTGNMVEDDLWIITGEISGADDSRHSTEITELIAKLLENDLGLEVLSAGFSRNRENELQNLSMSDTKPKEDMKLSSPLRLSSPSRRPVVLQRLKVTRRSLRKWLQRKGVSTSGYP